MKVFSLLDQITTKAIVSPLTDNLVWILLISYVPFKLGFSYTFKVLGKDLTYQASNIEYCMWKPPIQVVQGNSRNVVYPGAVKLRV